MAQTDFTIADVLAWARTKPADERYNYQDSTNCALCQFLRDTDRAERPRVSMWADNVRGGWSEDWQDRREYPKIMEPVLSGDGSFEGDETLWTFGGLVSRLEALCPETPVNASNWQSIDAYLTDIEAVESVRA